jgi:hypothetical protein
MLRDAALAVLDITEIAKPTVGLNDCRPQHPLLWSPTIVIDLRFRPKPLMLIVVGGQPCVCIGGHCRFGRRDHRATHLWSARKLASLRWRFYRNPLVRSFGLRPGARLARFWDCVTHRVARFLREGAVLAQLVAPLSCYLSAETLIQNPTLLRRKLAKLAPPKPVSAWLSYHDEYMGTGKLVSSPRFDRISEIVHSLGSTSVVELAGNQGFLSLLLASRRQITRIICTDCDSDVINKLHSHCKRAVGTQNNIIFILRCSIS